MSSICNIEIDMKKLAKHEAGNLIFRMMMFANDIHMDYFLQEGMIKLDGNSFEEQVQHGGRFYLMRLMCSHIRESFKLVEEIKKPCNKFVLDLIKKDANASKSFYNLLEYSPEGEMNTAFEIFLNIRNIGIFHYGDQLRKSYEEVIGRVAENQSVGTIQLADGLPFRVVFADDIFDMIFRKEVIEKAIDKDVGDSLKYLCSCIEQVLKNVDCLIGAVIKGVSNEFSSGDA